MVKYKSSKTYFINLINAIKGKRLSTFLLTIEMQFNSMKTKKNGIKLTKVHWRTSGAIKPIVPTIPKTKIVINIKKN